MGSRYSISITSYTNGKNKKQKILDLCAAPGGKTLQMLNQGAFVRAIDISKERTEILKKEYKKNKNI